VRREDLLQAIRVHRLDLEQLVRERLHGLALLLDDLARGLVAAHHQRPDLVVHPARRLLAEPGRTAVVVPGARGTLEVHRAERRHAELAHHLPRQLGGALDVVRGAARHLAQEQLLGDAAAHQDGDLRLDERLGVRVSIRLRQLHRHAERATARDDRHLVQRIGVGQQRSHHGVARLVIGAGDALLLAHRHRLPLDAHQHLVARGVEVAPPHGGTAGPRRDERRLVDQVREVGAREAGGPARDGTQIDVGLERHLARVHAQDLFAPLQIGIAHGDLTVETAGAQQRRVEDVGTVGGGHDDDAVGLGETVHLDEELIERLLALLVAERVAAAVAADGVELVDEDDARLWRRASLNSLRTREAPTPAYISTKSEPLAEMNGTPASPAIERASSVLPVPGGPTSRMPRGCGRRWPRTWRGRLRKSTISATSSLASSTPATSLNVTVTCCGSIVRAFSSVGTLPVITRNSASPANPKKSNPSATAL
jgi:hypothetical protein